MGLIKKWNNLCLSGIMLGERRKVVNDWLERISKIYKLYLTALFFAIFLNIEMAIYGTLNNKESFFKLLTFGYAILSYMIGFVFLSKQVTKLILRNKPNFDYNKNHWLQSFHLILVVTSVLLSFVLVFVSLAIHANYG
ncbi:hypothetical protein [uncultured Aquimarina sp.]|uniref:hypothetical protein n=1 Tax=uncultured Aquimarina sp. TaxID=575652 RepID=UPI0026067494|nr:hypothetical protein [uncultured Aquimarina sp.]